MTVLTRPDSSMHSHLLALACLVTATTFAADAPKLPAIPEQPIAKKKELLFADDFEKAELGECLENRGADFFHREGGAEGDADAVRCSGGGGGGEVKATAAVKGHQAVIGNEIPTKDSVIEFRFRLGARSRSRRSLTTGRSTARITGTFAWRVSRRRRSSSRTRRGSRWPGHGRDRRAAAASRAEERDLPGRD